MLGVRSRLPRRTQGKACTMKTTLTMTTPLAASVKSPALLRSLRAPKVGLRLALRCLALFAKAYLIRFQRRPVGWFLPSVPDVRSHNRVQLRCDFSRTVRCFALGALLAWFCEHPKWSVTVSWNARVCENNPPAPALPVLFCDALFIT